MNVPVVENLNFMYKQNFLSKINYFFWDKINPEPNNQSENDFIVTYVFYDIYLNDAFLKRSTDNFFYLDPGVGCEKKCVKIKTVFYEKKTNTFFFSEFSKEVCFISPPDRYCNLKINLSQNIKIKEKDKQKFQQKLQMLENKNKSSRVKYANAIKNKASASSLNMTNTIRSMYYKECQ